MSKPLYVYEHTPTGAAEQAGVYYRVEVPMHGLDKHGAKVFRRHVTDAYDDYLPAALASDVFHSYAAVSEPVLEMFRTIADMKPYRQGDGSIKVPPVTIWDCDDNTDFCHPVNSAFAVWGVRGYPDMDFLEPGDTIEIEINGEKQAIWVDQETRNGDGQLFDIQRNLKLLKLKHDMQRTATGVTVPSPDLADYFRNVLQIKNVYVYPNTVIPEHYSEWPMMPPPEGEVRILWQGSMSHYIDWAPLKGVLRGICEKYPQTKWLIWGDNFKHIHDMIPREQIEVFPWTAYPAYKLQRGLMRPHINICPLVDNIFNRGKSAIKWYEASIWKNPEATLAGNVGPYKEIVDGENGMLYSTPEEFAQKLSLLIEDAQLRQRLGHNAKKWVLENRTHKATLPGLIEFYEELQRQRLSPVLLEK